MYVSRSQQVACILYRKYTYRTNGNAAMAFFHLCLFVFLRLSLSSNPSIRALERVSIRYYDDIATRACGNCRELIGLYHVKRISSVKLLHGCLVSVRVNSQRGWTIDAPERLICATRSTRFPSIFRVPGHERAILPTIKHRSFHTIVPYYDSENIALIFHSSLSVLRSTCHGFETHAPQFASTMMNEVEVLVEKS